MSKTLERVDLSGGLPAAQDYPLSKPLDDQPLWHEGYWTQFYDPALDINVVMYLSAGPFSDFNMRFQRIEICLPGGDVLVQTDWGRGTTPDGPGAATLSYRCVGPFKRWTFSFSTVLDATTDKALRAGPLPAGSRKVFVEFALDGEMATPVWVPGASNSVERTFTTARYDHLFRGTGRLRIEEVGAEPVEHTLDGTGYRGHSWGPRNLASVGHGIFLRGLFDDGSAFGLTRNWGLNQAPGRDIAYIYTNGRMKPARILEAPDAIRNRRFTPMGDRYRIVLKTDNGEVAEIQGEWTCGVPQTQAVPRFVHFGFFDSAPTNMLCLTGNARYRWGDRLGYGPDERYSNVRLVDLSLHD